MPTCPSGHSSSADDYCDVCGLPITDDAPAAAPASTPAPPPPPPPAPSASECPNCQATNPANALFCEACGYDFTTGTMPRPITPSSLDLGSLGAVPASDAPADSAPAGVDDAGTAPRDLATPSVPSAPIAPPLEAGWVAEIWIDPDWYADQDSSDPLPSAGVPTVVALKTTSILVGRESQSRNIHPDIELGSDSGISRRHCQLTTDGTRWWVEDLGSSNGTYLGDTIGVLPQQPIPPGEKREIGPDARIYLGAWTRIVVRKAQPGEVG